MRRRDGTLRVKADKRVVGLAPAATLAHVQYVHVSAGARSSMEQALGSRT